VHLFLEPGSKQAVRLTVHADDGSSFGYKNGERTTVAVTARVKGDTLSITTRTLQNGYGDLPLGFVLYGNFKSVTVNRKPVTAEVFRYTLAGQEQKVKRVTL
jgi:hypothetical protein